jgi:hypothetical protein
MATTKYAPSKFLQRKAKEAGKTEAKADKPARYPGVRVPKKKGSNGTTEAAPVEVLSAAETATVITPAVPAVIITPSKGLTAEEATTLERPVEVVKAALLSGDIQQVFEYGRSLARSGAIQGVAKARLIHEIVKNWSAFSDKGMVQDDFENVVQAELNLSPDKAKKYARAWERLIENRLIPDKFVANWMAKPIEHWLLIAPAAADGLTPASRKRSRRWSRPSAAPAPARPAAW